MKAMPSPHRTSPATRRGTRRRGSMTGRSRAARGHAGPGGAAASPVQFRPMWPARGRPLSRPPPRRPVSVTPRPYRVGMLLRSLLPVRCPGCGRSGAAPCHRASGAWWPPGRVRCPPGTDACWSLLAYDGGGAARHPPQVPRATARPWAGWPTAWPRSAARRPARWSRGRRPPRPAGASGASTRPSCWPAPLPADGGSRAAPLWHGKAGPPQTGRSLADRRAGPLLLARAGAPGSPPGAAGRRRRRRAHDRVDAGGRRPGAGGRRRGSVAGLTAARTARHAAAPPCVVVVATGCRSAQVRQPTSR